MPHFEAELPKVVVKQQRKMMSTYKSKAVVAVLALLLYVYILMFIKSFYIKSKRLDAIMELALETEKKIQNVHNIDQNIGMRMSQLDKLYEEY